MKLSQVLDKLMTEKDISAYKISKSTGISDRLIGYWRKGEKLPGAENLLTIANYFGVSVDYLLTGQEKNSSSLKLTDEEQEILKLFNALSHDNKIRIKERAEVLAELEKPIINEPVVIEEPEEQESIFIEFATLKASAGTGEQLIDNPERDVIEVVKSEKTLQAKFAIQIHGDSMEPEYSDGEIVLVKTQPQINIGQIGIFTINDMGYIKKLGTDRLISVNPEYDDICFEEEQDIRCKGLVIGVLNEEDIVND